jgi:hypothetical protein
MKKFALSLFAIAGFIFLNAQDTTLNEYTGTYKFPEGGPVTSVDVKIENGALVASSAAGSSPMEKISRDTFSLVTYNGTVYFTRDSTKKINGIKIQVEETILEGKKESIDLSIDRFKSSLWKREYDTAI